MFYEKYIVKALWYLFAASVRYPTRPSNNGRTLSVSRGNEIEIALSNAINYVDYRRNFCCHGSFARVCPKGMMRRRAAVRLTVYQGRRARLRELLARSDNG